MVQKNRDKEVWLIPKRGSLHQTVCILEAVINEKLHNKAWNPSRQNNIGNLLRKRGASLNGKTLSNQSIRTLVASVPQYFGFLYIDTNTTPNTLKVTPAGQSLLDNHKSEITDIGTLREGEKKGLLIRTSEVFLNQFEKLQITNPIIKKDCDNILVFPFRTVLSLILELGYLDREELAYFVFSIRDESEIPLYVKKIKKFRSQDISERKDEIREFSKTHIGQITLVKASSASYFEAMAANTGIIKRLSITTPNPGEESIKIQAIKIDDNYREYVNELLNDKYKNAEVYDFEENRELWIQYIGNPDRLSPPIDYEITNTGSGEYILLIKKEESLLAGDLLASGQTFTYPVFLDEEYEISCLSIDDGSELYNKHVKPTLGNTTYEVNLDDNQSKRELTNQQYKEQLKSQILDHSKAKNFATEYNNYLEIVSTLVGQDLIKHKNLRGGVYEYLFYLLLEHLKEEDILDDVYWNGKVREYGLPAPAPGGSQGEPDIVFIIDNESFILELTTIKAKSGQWRAEGSSVPAHLKVFMDNHNVTPHGIFVAPAIHKSIIDSVRSNLSSESINIKFFEDENFLDILLSSDRKFIKSKLM